MSADIEESPLVSSPPSVSQNRPHSPGLGLLLCSGVASVSIFAASFTKVVSPLLWAGALGIVLGTALRLLAAHVMALAEPGIVIAKSWLLRVGIILFGAKLTLHTLLGVGAASLLADLFSVISTLWIGIKLGRALKVAPAVAALISTGSAICGCSAVAAAQPIIDAEPHEVAAGVAAVVLCGTVNMFLYPLLFRFVPVLAANHRLMGIYTGSTVHELAGVVAAGNAMSPEVASVAVVTKLMRVCMLEPWLIILFYSGIGQKRRVGYCSESLLSSGASKTSTSTGATFPWFAFGFMGLTTLNTLVHFSPAVTSAALTLSGLLLASAMAALGLQTDLAKIRQLGARPFVLAMSLWVHLLAAGLAVDFLLVALL